MALRWSGGLFPKARLNVLRFPSRMVNEGQSRATEEARICVPAPAPPSLPPPLLALALAYRQRSHLWRGAGAAPNSGRSPPRQDGCR